MPRGTCDEEIDAMVAENLIEADNRRAEIKALQKAIGNLSDPLLRRILYKIVELNT